MKQPKVPEYREGEGVVRYIRTMTLFLKDFTMDVWSAIRKIEGRLKDLEDKA